MNTLLDIVFLEGGFIHNLIEWVLSNGGLFVLLFVVFAETGLFVGFFLPGDSLLVAAGIYLRKSPEKFYDIPYYWVILMVLVASIVGNMVGYWFGRKTGPMLYDRKDTWLFRRKHLMRAREFYDEYGKGTVFIAKFLPVVRTFAPIVAGIVKMNWATFLLYNILGSVAWVSSMMLGGYFIENWLSKNYGISLSEYIEPIVLGLVLITTVPVLWKLFFAKKKVVPVEEIKEELDKEAKL